MIGAVDLGFWDCQEQVAAATALDSFAQKSRDNSPPETAMGARKHDRHASSPRKRNAMQAKTDV